MKRPNPFGAGLALAAISGIARAPADTMRGGSGTTSMSNPMAGIAREPEGLGRGVTAADGMIADASAQDVAASADLTNADQSDGADLGANVKD